MYTHVCYIHICIYIYIYIYRWIYDLVGGADEGSEAAERRVALLPVRRGHLPCKDWQRRGHLRINPGISALVSPHDQQETPHRVSGIGYRVSGFGYRVSGVGMTARLPPTASRKRSIASTPVSTVSASSSCFGIRDSGFGIRVSDFVFRVSGFLFRVSGFGFRVRFRVYGFALKVNPLARKRAAVGGGALLRDRTVRCRANLAQTGQSRPDSERPSKGWTSILQMDVHLKDGRPYKGVAVELAHLVLLITDVLMPLVIKPGFVQEIL